MIALRKNTNVSYRLSLLLLIAVSVFVVNGRESEAALKIPPSSGLILIGSSNEKNHRENNNNDKFNHFTSSSVASEKKDSSSASLQSPIIVTTCSSDTITFNDKNAHIHNDGLSGGRDDRDDKINETKSKNEDGLFRKLQPGNMVIQMIDDNEGHVYDNDLGFTKSECSLIFRKIVALKTDGQSETKTTYETTFATFADIFPADFYDPVLSDMAIEPIFRDIITSTQQQQQERNLQDETNGTNPDDCLAIPLLTIILGLLSCCSLGLPLILPASIIVVPVTVGAGTLLTGLSAISIIGLPLAPIIFTMTILTAISCIAGPFLLIITPALIGIWGVTLITVVSQDTCNYGFSSASRSGSDFMERYFDIGNTTSSNNTISSNDATRKLLLAGKHEHLLPKTCSDWMSKSDVGDCDYVNCNVGTKGDSPKCYADCNDGECTTSHLVPATSLLPFDFKDAFCIQDHCYASNVFDKAACDIRFYKSLVSTCSKPEGTADISAIANTGSGSTIVEHHHQFFPINRASFLSGGGNHCQLISVLFYLSVKVLGGKIHETRQNNQNQFNQQLFCSNGD